MYNVRWFHSCVLFFKQTAAGFLTPWLHGRCNSRVKVVLIQTKHFLLLLFHIIKLSTGKLLEGCCKKCSLVITEFCD